MNSTSTKAQDGKASVDGTTQARNDGRSNKPSQKLGPTASAISKALDSNLALQSELKCRLSEVRRKMSRNRLVAANIISSLSRCSDFSSETFSSWPEPLPNQFWRNFTNYKNKEKNQDGVGDGLGSVTENENVDDKSNNHPYPKVKKDFDEGGGCLGGESSDQSKGKNSSCLPSFSVKNIKSRWEFDHTRKWEGQLFVDPDGSKPIKANSSSPTMTRAWGASEINRLRQTVEKVRGQAEPTEFVQNSDIFERVASEMDQSLHRSADECRAAYLSLADPSISMAKFSKQESLFILNMVRKEMDKGGVNVDWKNVCAKLNESTHNKSSSGNVRTRRTPWQCFKHFKSTLQTPAATCPVWSPDEDELFFKYIAAHGPQFLFQGDSAAHCCRNLFPSRTPKQLCYRTHSSLFNPNYTENCWSEDEERKLALLMRSYSSEDHSLQQASSNVHFPNRSSKSVSEKWCRSLDPQITSQPFTSEEDEKLLVAVKSEVSDDWSSCNWASIAKKFPHRNPYALLRRWNELAEDRDVAMRCGNQLIKKAFAKPGVVGKDDNSLLSPDDFVIRPKKRNKQK